MESNLGGEGTNDVAVDKVAQAVGVSAATLER